jgi:hypothetical protein
MRSELWRIHAFDQGLSAGKFSGVGNSQIVFKNIFAGGQLVKEKMGGRIARALVEGKSPGPSHAGKLVDGLKTRRTVVFEVAPSLCLRPQGN